MGRNGCIPITVRHTRRRRAGEGGEGGDGAGGGGGHGGGRGRENQLWPKCNVRKMSANVAKQ